MCRTVAWKALQFHRKVEQPFHLRISPIFFPQLRHAGQSAFQIPWVSGQIWHLLTQPINLAIAHLQHAPGVAQHRPRLQFSKSDDLRNLTRAVFFLDITNDFATARFAKVDIEVRHRHTVGV